LKKSCSLYFFQVHLLALEDNSSNQYTNHLESSNYKYRIKELYYSLPVAEKAQAMQEDCEAMGITLQHLRKIWGYKVEDESEARPSQLVLIASRFGLSVEDLINDNDTAEWDSRHRVAAGAQGK